MPSLADLRLFAKYHLVRRVHTYPAREHELGLVSLGYEPAAFERELRAASDGFEFREAAALVYRGKRHPIFSVRTPGAERAKRRLLVLSGVHGNEQAGILAVPELLRRFARDAALATVGLEVLTPVNPVGAAELSRLNGDGYDVNRDFVLFLTREARVVREAFEALSPDFVVSLHEGPQDATFMFANEHVPRDVADRLLAALRDGGTRLATKDYFGATLKTPGLSPASLVTRGLVGLWAGALRMRTTGAWSGSRGVPELTLESGWKSPDRAARVRPHVDLVLAVARELAVS